MEKNRNRTPKYLAAKEKLARSIKDGSITSKLPGERVLAEQYGVSYMTMRKTIESLVEEGYLLKKSTKGTFVNTCEVPKKKTANIAFFLAENIKDGISSPYYSLIFKALEKRLQRTDYHLMYISDEKDLNIKVCEEKYDGLIISYFPWLEDYVAKLSQVIPVVLIDNPADEVPAKYIGMNNYDGIYSAVKYLNNLKHTEIAYISGTLNNKIGQDRLNGYKSAIKDFDLKNTKQFLIQGDYSHDSGYQAALQLISYKTPPTAIVCSNDVMAFGAIKAIREYGLNVPEDISVIGFDNIELCSQIYPSLTTIAAPIKDISNKAIESLMFCLQGEDLDLEDIEVPTRLVIRKSCSTRK